MSNNGTNEHRWENRTEVLLIIGTLGALAYYNWRWGFLVWFFPIWITVITVVHTIARIYHIMERKEHGNPNWWKLWK